jgi:hypothetical protein
VSLAADGSLHGLAGVAPDTQRDMAAALRDGTLPATRLTAPLAGRAGRLMGEEGVAHFAPVAPVGTAVTSATPLFRWTPLPSATAYRVRIVDAALEPVMESELLAATSWRPATALPRERVLLWQVEAETPDGTRTTPAPPAPEARLLVLDEATVARLTTAVADADGSALAAVVIYVEAGALDDAADALARLAGMNPRSPVVARLQQALAARRPGTAVSPS